MIWKHQTTQDWIQDRVNREAYISEPDYERPLWKEPKGPKKRVFLPALVGQMIKDLRP